ncbi:Hypothetical predicted protein [Mytilus galloprovincialis]|uniref:Uncharacterized protein n=1 Tax=Mytilus galloprovincialis TaxID=29158 RepID=A0A8B6F9Y8_MYTGA|nr:Hypothetical predicted protein [Mytilus galloprovincialis]
MPERTTTHVSPSGYPGEASWRGFIYSGRFYKKHHAQREPPTHVSPSLAIQDEFIGIRSIMLRENHQHMFHHPWLFRAVFYWYKNISQREPPHMFNWLIRILHHAQREPPTYSNNYGASCPERPTILILWSRERTTTYSNNYGASCPERPTQPILITMEHHARENHQPILNNYGASMPRENHQF